MMTTKTAINKCPSCGGTINIVANVEVRLTLYDNENVNYELTTDADDIINQVKRVVREPIETFDDYECYCENCGENFSAKEIKPGRFEIAKFT